MVPIIAPLAHCPIAHCKNHAEGHSHPKNPPVRKP